MSIATQITRLNNNIEAMKTTKQQIKDAMNNDFDIIANEQIESYDTLIENGLELYKDCIPSVETNQATGISVTDAMKYSRNKLQLFGNTEQAQYTGKNIFNANGTYYVRRESTSISVNGNEITITNTSTTTSEFVWWNIPVTTGQNYNISYTNMIENPESNNNHVSYNFSNAPITEYTSDFTDYTQYKKLSKVNKTSSAAATDNYLVVVLRTTASANNKIIGLQVEQGSTATDYEQYVGGIPSPNPDYPQDIHVVTGNNTVTVGSTNYPINLGSLELCKIGNYQDYLYKENGNWYKYGNIRKYTTCIEASITTTGYRFKLKDRAELHDMSSATNTEAVAILKCAKPGGTSTYKANIRYNYGWGGIAIVYNAGLRNMIGEKTTSELKQWFNSNEIVYLVINTTYDYIDITQITDTTLISQLDAIYEHLQLQKGINNITVTPGDLAPYMKLSYKNYESNLTNE